MNFNLGQISIWPFIILISILGCTQKQPSTRTPEEEILYSQGKKVYMTVCVTCHNPDPKLDGSIGPANYGSSLDLLRAKVIKGEYPPGYKPKRNTVLMPPFEEHTKDIEALHVFLNQ
jgi:mono/diheme cytochrome c family protein